MEWYPNTDGIGYRVRHLDGVPDSAKDVKRAEREATRRLKFPVADPCPTEELCHREVPLTKRKVLSDIAKIFDPLGLLSCVVIVLKICMQEIWMTKLAWDDILPNDVTCNFVERRNEMGVTY